MLSGKVVQLPHKSEVQQTETRPRAIHAWPRRSIVTFDYVAGLLIVLGGVVRLALIALGWPHLNSDEGTMGLMARHIANGTDFPIYFYGQSYMGALEAYLAAPIVLLFSSSTVALRIGLILLFSLFLVVMYVFVRQVYDARVAIGTVALLIVGSDAMLFRQLQAIGGYVETLLFAAILMLISARLYPVDSGRVMTSRRAALLAAWGFTAGLALWTDLLIAPFLLASALLLLTSVGRNLFGTCGIILVAWVLVGVSPLIVYDVSAGHNNAITVFLSTYHGHGYGHVLSGIMGTVLVGLPSVTGGSAVCRIDPASAWPLVRLSHQAAVCTVIHGAWGCAVILMWFVAVVATVREYRWMHGEQKVPGVEPLYEVEMRVRISTCLLGAAGLTVILYSLSPAAAESPAFSSRYLTCLWLVLPALLAPFAHPVRSKVRDTLRIAPLVILAAVLLLGTWQTFRSVSATRSLNAWQAGFVASLRLHRVTHMYTDYWTCDRVAFQSHEDVTCAVLGNNLRPGLDRVPGYETAVRGDPKAVYAFPIGSKAAKRTAIYFAHRKSHYWRANSYDIFEPG